MRKLLMLWNRLHSSLWFIPTTMTASFVVLAVLLTQVDLQIGNEWTHHFGYLFGVGTEGARGMLSAIATSMMTVASLSFSLTISTLAVASSQYSSRVIRNFMADLWNQWVLGYFVGLFAYCLVVLRTIRGGDDEFVPAIAVLAGLVLALVSINALIFFIHHLASSIQVSVILERVTSETVGVIEGLFPEPVAEPADGELTVEPMPDDWHPVTAGRMGYVQSVDPESLVKLAVEHDTVVRMDMDIGGFVTPNSVLCSVLMTEKPGDGLIRSLQRVYSIGGSRTVEEDAAFGVRQIVDIALKALSPGVNDTTTAVMCVQHLGAIVEAMAARDIPNRFRAKDGVLRVIAKGRAFDTLVALCFDQIRLCSSQNVAVLVAQLEALETAARLTGVASRRKTLIEAAERTAAIAADSLAAEYDRAVVRAVLTRTLRSLKDARPDGAELLICKAPVHASPHPGLTASPAP
ncbi:MAG: DUF2254 domain-containing protein [Tepidisphaeraceae bacterium]